MGIGEAKAPLDLDLSRASSAQAPANLEGPPAAFEVRTMVTGAPPSTFEACAQAGRDPPDANLDLWAQASKVLGGAPVTIVRTSNAAGGPSRFAGAWAELARDKSKSKGAFASPIPKVNLTRFPLP